MSPLEMANSYFNSEEEEKLIECVRGFPAIYNIQSTSYKNIGAKAIAWKEIAEKTNKTEDACKAKWKHIRDWYIRKKKAGKLPVGSGTFLAHLQMRYDRLGFLAKSEDETEPLCDFSTDFSEQIKEERTPDVSDDSNMMEDSEEHALIQLKKNPSILKLRIPKKKFKTNHKKFFPMRSKKKSELKLKKRKTEEKDEKESNSILIPKHPIDEFFGAMASIVKQLPPNIQVHLKQEVSQIILMAESRVVSSHDTLSQFSNLSSGSSISLNSPQTNGVI